MQWGSLESFLNMGGYGFFVWGAYLVCAAVITIEIVLVRGRQRRALADARVFAGGEAGRKGA